MGLLTAGLGPAVPATALAQVVRIPIEGVIDKGLVPYVQRSLAAAGESGARLAILDINTPGGRIDAAWAIVVAVQESPGPVSALVDRGLSAGAEGTQEIARVRRGDPRDGPRGESLREDR